MANYLEKKKRSLWLQLSLLIIVIGGVSFTSVVVASPLPVYFGGFAFLGDFSAKDKLYPYSAALLEADSNKPSLFDRALQSKLNGFTNDSYTLELNQLGALGPNSPSATVLAFALDRETVSVERIAGQYKLLIELSAQALFFDFKQQSVIASFPVTIQYIDLKNSNPTPDEIQAIIKELYVGNLGINIFDEFVNTIKAASLNLSVNHRVRVTEVAIEDEARAVFPESKKSDVAAMQTFIAQEFGKYLSKNQHIPVLPYVVGAAIGRNMAMRIGDGSVYNLKIPEEDYAIHLDLIKFKKVEFKKTDVGASFVYGAFLHVKVIEPLSKHIYFEATIKNGATKIVPAGQDVVDDWAAYQESLLALIDRVTQQFSQPQADWVETHMGNKSLVANMKDLEKVLQSCK